MTIRKTSHAVLIAAVLATLPIGFADGFTLLPESLVIRPRFFIRSFLTRLKMKAKQPSGPISIKGQVTPIVGRVAAGQPLMAWEEVEGHLTPEFMGARRGRFSVRVTGASMSGEGILEGDYVIVDPDAAAASGELVVAYLGAEQEVTVKRLQRRRSGWELHPANPEYDILHIPHNDPFFRLAGKVVGLLRRF